LFDSDKLYVGADPVGIAPGQYDFQTLVIHELGHAIGLGHSDDAASAMYPRLAAGQLRRSLSVADLVMLRHDEEPEMEPVLGVAASPHVAPVRAGTLEITAMSIADIGSPLSGTPGAPGSALAIGPPIEVGPRSSERRSRATPAGAMNGAPEVVTTVPAV